MEHLCVDSIKHMNLSLWLSGVQLRYVITNLLETMFWISMLNTYAACEAHTWNVVMPTQVPDRLGMLFEFRGVTVWPSTYSVGRPNTQQTNSCELVCLIPSTSFKHGHSNFQIRLSEFFSSRNIRLQKSQCWDQTGLFFSTAAENSNLGIIF